MARLYKDFLHFIESNQLIQPDDKILVAVSGGVDSMVLLDLFLQADWQFGVAHCNFNLRGEESDKDEGLVVDFCRTNNIHFDVKSFDTKSYAAENNQSIQMAARDLRYQWFRELMDKYGYSKLATAHHSDDNLETILFNLTKGTGVMGLAGIPLKEKRIIRPLLFATREDILQYATEKVQWREDSSNEDSRYVRSRIRKEIIPVLEEINPSLKKNFGKTAERIREAKEIVREYAKEKLSAILFHDGEYLKIDKDKLTEAAAPTLLLYECLKGYGFNYDSCRAIVDQLTSTGAIFSTTTHTLNIDREMLLIKRNYSTEMGELQLDEKTRGFVLDGRPYSVRREERSVVEIVHNSGLAFLDLKLLQFPLRLRRWQEGDRFQPFGMQGTKKVSDFLIDEKVPLLEKEKVMVLESDGEIVWLVDHRIAQNFAISDTTSEVLIISPD